MILREQIEKREYEILSPLASKAAETKGRSEEEEKCPSRTDYQRDRDRIIHSKSFRRLMHKTQVFLSPEGDHFRTRLTHTLEVAQIAKTCARILGLNEDLTEAIALGHDLGHTPFGHNGESFLNERHPKGFQHNVQSLRVVDVLEYHGEKRGMNLTWEVRDGIENHTGPNRPSTLEGQIVRFCDRIAYINHDIDDALRSGVIRQESLPEDCVQTLGSTHKQRIDTLVRDLSETSDGRTEIAMSQEKAFYMDKLRNYMFENVYHSKIVKKDEELEKIRVLIFMLYDYFCENWRRLSADLRPLIKEYGVEEMVKDHIAGMTDRYAIHQFREIFIPQGWK